MTDLVTALTEAVTHARTEIKNKTGHAVAGPNPLFLTCMADRLIAKGWPASLDGPLAPESSPYQVEPDVRGC